MLVDLSKVKGKDEAGMAIEALKWVLMAVGAAVLGVIACYFLLQLVVYVMYALLDMFTRKM